MEIMNRLVHERMKDMSQFEKEVLAGEALDIIKESESEAEVLKTMEELGILNKTGK